MNDLSKLNEKRKQWLDRLSGDDRSAIVSQLTSMSWYAASFGVVNEARRYAPPDPDSDKGDVQLNELIHSLINRGFLADQLFSIRRLMDRKKGAYSLIGLLKDMRKHRRLLTRQAIFEAEGLTYDYESIQRRFYEDQTKNRKVGIVATQVSPDLDWHRHKRRDQVIDVLAGVTSQPRHREDTIQAAVLENLSDKADAACKEIIKYVNNFLAHAAAPGSQERVNADEISITLNCLWTAHEHLCQVAGFLAIYILGDSCAPFLPTPQYDQFQYMDRPLVESSRIPELQNVWRKFDSDYRDWSQWTLNDYQQEFGKKPEG